MNLYVLDESPVRSAMFHSDYDISVHPHRIVQALADAVQLQVKCEIPDIPPRSEFPSRWAVCASISKETYCWIVGHGLAMCGEYLHRFKQKHSSQDLMKFLALMKGVVPENREVTLPLMVPKDYDSPDLVRSYRSFYKEKIARDGKWTNRGRPYWIDS